MTDIQRDNLLANCLEDFHRRRALGENPAPDEYRDRLRDSHAEFVDILDASDAIDQAMAPTVEEPLPRTFGAYTLLSELGRGAMGVVYEALHRDLGRTVAIKVLRSDWDTEPTAIKRFRDEAIRCAQVHHDHIVEIYEAGQAEGRWFYTMRLVRGPTLSSLIKQNRVPKARTLAKGLAGVADALHALHTYQPHGIVHRDVKPNNVIVDEASGRFMICDFGLARMLDSGKLTKTGDAVGTPYYMSPEQMLGKRDEVDARSDVYGLGATMYEALTGRPPFKTEDPSALWGMIVTQRPTPPRELDASLDSDCDDVVMKCLEKRREDRYQSAADLRDDLIAYATDGVVRGKPVSSFVRSMRRAKRYAPAMAAGLVLAIGGFYWWTHRPAKVSVTSAVEGTEVAMDGETPSAAPYDRSVAPGVHVLRWTSSIFGSDQRSLDLKAGDSWSMMIPKVIQDAGNPNALKWAEQETFPGETLPPFVDPAASGLTRGDRGDNTIDVLYPRGDVRLEDLKGNYRIDAPFGADTEGSIEFRHGAEVLYSKAFVPKEKSARWEEEIPAEVRKGLKVGQTITWGFYSQSKRKNSNFIAKFTVVGEDLAKDFAKIDKKMGDQPETIRALLRARACLNHKLLTSALIEALRVVEAEPANVPALAIVHESLTRMRLDGSVLWSEVDQQLRGAPADKRAALFGRK